MMRLIDADKLKQYFAENVICYGTVSELSEVEVDDIIDNQPTVQQWISVEDRLPKNERVLIVFDDGFMSVVDFANGDFELWANSGDVTHWMPLPEPPKAGADTNVGSKEGEMRTIRFRGYSKTYKSWRYGCLDITKDGKCFIKSINERGAAERTRVDEDSVGQFIGQTDVFGNPIYEGDFLADDEFEVYKVVWDKQTSMFVISGNDIVTDFDHYRGSEFEIVANGYEAQND